MDISKRPKGEPIDINAMKTPKGSKHTTLLKHLSENDTVTRLTYLKRFAEQQGSKSKWVDYLRFIQINGSGDILSFSEKNLKYIEKMIKEIDLENEKPPTAS